MKASESETKPNQRQLATKNLCQLQSMSSTLCHKISATVQSKINFRCLAYHKMIATISKCQLSYLELLGTCPIVGILKLSGTEMTYT